MAVLNAQYKHPASDYSQGLKTLIDSMLKINPQERPNIQQVLLLPGSIHVIGTHIISGSRYNRAPPPIHIALRHLIEEVSISP
jgi:hypothetical protein